MPLHSNSVGPHTTIALWHITEPLNYFEGIATLHENIAHPDKRRQWYATRHLLNVVSGQPVTVLKDEFGKPYLPPNNPTLSLTHTPQFAGVMLGRGLQVGIDLEPINPKVQRIAHKFLQPNEVDAIAPGELTDKLIVYWSAKEALYKLHGRRRLEFKSQLLIQPFTLQQQGTLNAAVIADDVSWNNLTVHYRFFDGHVLTHVATQ